MDWVRCAFEVDFTIVKKLSFPSYHSEEEIEEKESPTAHVGGKVTESVV